MSKILVICPTIRDYREIKNLGIDKKIDFYYYDFLCSELKDLMIQDGFNSCIFSDPEIEIEKIIKKYASYGLNGVFSSDDYPGSTFSAVISNELGLSKNSLKHNLICQQKFFSREIQFRAVPEAVPFFQSIDLVAKSFDDVKYPIFLKPVKSVLSVGAQIVNSQKNLREVINSQCFCKFIYPFEVFLNKYADRKTGTNQYISENIVSGKQVTLDGFVFNGEVFVIGIVDSIFIENTLSFKRFEYPSSLPESIQHRMSDITKKVIKEFKFHNSMFNIEFIYNEIEDKIYIIEIHSRMSSQFADLYEKVDGINTYSIAFDLLLNIKPKVKKNKGKHKMAASCILRLFKDCFVKETPKNEELEKVYELFSDPRIEIFVRPDMKLSHCRQDKFSFRYGIINLGGRDLQDILEKLKECKKLLTFKFIAA